MKLKAASIWLFLLLAVTSFATELSGLDQRMVGQELQITPQFEVLLSDKVRHAINSGIVITFVMQVKINKTVDWWFDTQLDSKIQTFQVRYFSLSNQYQLHNRQLQTNESFVELDQLLEYMGNQTTFSFRLEEPGDYVSTRIFLDKQALPSIMQLPNVFDADWNLNSDWQTTVLINPTAAASP